MVLALCAALLLAALVVAALAVPVDVHARAALDDELTVSLRIGWLDERLSYDITPSSEPSHEKKRVRPTRAQLALLFEEPFRRRVEQLVGRLRRWISIEQLYGRGRFGLPDPADTGMALGWLYPLLALSHAQRKVDFELSPHFGGEMLEGQLDGSVRAVPLGVLLAGLGFVLTPETLRTLRRWRSLRE